MDVGISVARALGDRLGGQWRVEPLRASGFCGTWCARSGADRVFLKSLPVSQSDRLEAEDDGLRALAATGAVRVPAVVACWRDEVSRLGLLAMEWLPLATPGPHFGARLGAALGRLHLAQPAGREGCFGWARDNYLGATPQHNAWRTGPGAAGWMSFLAHQRLGWMRDQLTAKGAPLALARAIDAAVQALPRFFEDGHHPRPSLIHGDLWQGNWGMLDDGTPVVYDPAVSCSDAEAELAMMELFGAPPGDFWPAYREACALHEGYPWRRPLYQLYHLLNHALLFGGGYVRQSMTAAERLARGPG